MKKLRLVLAAAVALAVISPAVRAQEASKGDIARPATFEGLMAAMQRTPAAVDELLKRTVINESDVLPVDTKPLIVGQSDELLKIQLDRQKDGIKQLQEVLSKHRGVADRLKKESANPSINEIIAVELLADGKVQLFYRKN